jgi:hypothetical protein
MSLGFTGGGVAAPIDASYIVQTPSATLTGEQALSALASGLLYVTTGTGVLTIANAGTDYYVPGGVDVAVVDGGTGRSSHTAYAVLCGGTNGTNPQQSVASVGSSGDLLVSNGAAMLPTFQTIAYEVTTNKATDFVTVNNTLYPSVQAVKTYADALVVGLLDDRGNYDASVNTFPAAGGSGTAGAILKGDIWYISVAGTLGGSAVNIGDSVRALVDTPAQTAANWSILESNIGYTPENVANKSNDTTLAASSATLYPTQNATKVYADTKSPLAGSSSLVTTGTVTSGVWHSERRMRIQSVASSATVTANWDADDQVNITAQAAALLLASPSGSATEGQRLMIRIKDNGTARAITYGADWRAIGVTLPVTTVLSKTLYLGGVWNGADSKVDVVATAQEA